jgi:urea transport system ATP-binding protein
VTTRTLLYVEGVTVSFEGFLALRTLNFVVDTGERVRVIIGPNGAGKTTLFDVLTGHVRPESGRVIFGANTDLLELGTPAIATLGITRKFQTPSVFPSHTVLQNMVLAAGGKGLRATLRSAAGMDPVVAEVLDQVGLLPHAERPAGTLSHGQKQWLEIAMLLAERPALLLLDEPVAGMSRPEREFTVALLDAIVERTDSAVMLIEHDMEFVRKVASRGHKVTVLHEGSVLSEGSLEHVQADARVVEAYLGRGRIKQETACST